MAYYDKLLEFSTAQTLTAANLLTKSTNSLDLLSRRDIGEGDQMYVEFLVTTAFTVGSGLPVMQFGVSVGDSDDALPTNLTTLSLSGGPGIAPYTIAAALFAGSRFYLPVPRMSLMVSGLAGIDATTKLPNYLQRYMFISYWQPSFATAAFATGAITARMLLNPGEVVKSYRSSITIA